MKGGQRGEGEGRKESDREEAKEGKREEGMSNDQIPDTEAGYEGAGT